MQNPYKITKICNHTTGGRHDGINSTSTTTQPKEDREKEPRSGRRQSYAQTPTGKNQGSASNCQANAMQSQHHARQSDSTKQQAMQSIQQREGRTIHLTRMPRSSRSTTLNSASLKHTQIREDASPDHIPEPQAARLPNCGVWFIQYSFDAQFIKPQAHPHMGGCFTRSHT